MKMLSVQVEDKMVQQVDEFIEHSGLYSSRSEFLKDSIRKNLSALLEKEVYKKKVRESFHALAKKAVARGWNGKLPTGEQRAKIVEEYLKEKGINLT